MRKGFKANLFWPEHKEVTAWPRRPATWFCAFATTRRGARRSRPAGYAGQRFRVWTNGSAGGGGAGACGGRLDHDAGRDRRPLHSCVSVLLLKVFGCGAKAQPLVYHESDGTRSEIAGTGREIAEQAGRGADDRALEELLPAWKPSLRPFTAPCATPPLPAASGFVPCSATRPP